MLSNLAYMPLLPSCSAVLLHFGDPTIVGFWVASNAVTTIARASAIEQAMPSQHCPHHGNAARAVYVRSVRGPIHPIRIHAECIREGNNAFDHLRHGESYGYGVENAVNVWVGDIHGVSRHECIGHDVTEKIKFSEDPRTPSPLEVHWIVGLT